MFLLHKNPKCRFQDFITDPLLLQGCLYVSMVDTKTQEVFIINALFYVLCNKNKTLFRKELRVDTDDGSDMSRCFPLCIKLLIIFAFFSDLKQKIPLRIQVCQCKFVWQWTRLQQRVSLSSAGLFSSTDCTVWLWYRNKSGLHSPSLLCLFCILWQISSRFGTRSIEGSQSAWEHVHFHFFLAVW